MGLPVFTGIVLLVAWFTFARKRAFKKSKEGSDLFWKKELEANRTRKKPLDSLNYISIPLESLPLLNTTDEKLLEYQESIQSFSAKKIVNLTGISNTDLKLTYGAPNLTILTSYDQNFTALVRLLYLWGKYLYELGYLSEAAQVLEFGIECKTDISKHYRLLSEIYKMTGNTEKIKSLISAADTLNSLMKNSIVRELQKALERT